MAKAFLGLGSNIGDRRANLAEALRRLSQEGVTIKKVSSVYESQAVLVEDQPDFLNIACEIHTSLSPHGLLDACLEVEANMGRIRRRRWGPRNIDIDLLLYESLTIDEPRLIVPHPRLAERPFVTVPLLEIASELILPGGECLCDLCEPEHKAGIALVSGPLAADMREG